MPIEIRDATAADVPAITVLYAGEVRDGVNTYEYDAPGMGEMQQRMETILAAAYPYLVAELDGEFAGYAYASGFRGRIGYRATVENSVYVVPAMQGKGVGRRLMQRLIDDCAARGFRQMVSVIGDPANTASIRLHETLDFRHVGTFPGLAWKHGRWLDTVFMQRPLGPADGAPPHDG